MFSFLCVLLIILAIQECHDEAMNNEAKYRKKELAELEQLQCDQLAQRHGSNEVTNIQMKIPQAIIFIPVPSKNPFKEPKAAVKALFESELS